MDTALVIRGRRIADDDLSVIRSLIEKHRSRGRQYIAQELCGLWEWKQKNGLPKTMACSELLLRLERAGLVKLPPRKNGHRDGPRRFTPIQMPLLCQTPITAYLKELGPLEIRMVRGTPWEPLYKALIQTYHYLGYCQTVGEHLKYIAFHQDRPLACIGWGSAAWKVVCRDLFIGWEPLHRTQNIHLLAQNTRFLILPWVRVPHLASHLLGRMARILSSDWQRIYHHPLALLETFVDTTRFQGTCYQAANWIAVGSTRGRGKWDRSHQDLLPVKAVLLYPLIKNFREVLTHLN